MTDFNAVLALLSAAAYREGRSSNQWITKLPIGVDPLPGSLGYVSNTDSGFEASAFLYDGKIVISYAGTTDWRDGLAARGAGGRVDATAWLDHGGAVICGSVVRGRGVKEEA